MRNEGFADSGTTWSLNALCVQTMKNDAQPGPGESSVPPTV